MSFTYIYIPRLDKSKISILYKKIKIKIKLKKRNKMFDLIDTNDDFKLIYRLVTTSKILSIKIC